MAHIFKVAIFSLAGFVYIAGLYDVDACMSLSDGVELLVVVTIVCNSKARAIYVQESN